MGCPTEVVIGDNLVFGICTHDPDTGELTDADGPPSYRIYEGETATPILTDTMAKLDDDNTTGFYTELIACTVGNGFENGKSYTIYIQATVDSATGGISFGFKAKSALGVAKNTALNNFEFLMVDSTDHVSGKTGLTVTAQRSIDGGAFGNCANAVFELASGVYKTNLAAVDLNGAVITLLLTASGADSRVITIITQP